MKKVLVLGATGQTGRLVVKHALASGHRVRALVRNIGRVDTSDPGLEVVVADVARRSELQAALVGCDALVMALGHPQKWNSLLVGVKEHRHLLRDVTSSLVELMPTSGMRRIVAISAAGAGDSVSRVPYWFQLMIRYTGIRQPYRDHDDQERILKGSSLDWTLVRPVRLTDSDVPRGLRIASGSERQQGNVVSRLDVARFCVEALERDDMIRESPIVCGG